MHTVYGYVISSFLCYCCQCSPEKTFLMCRPNQTKHVETTGEGGKRETEDSAKNVKAGHRELSLLGRRKSSLTAERCIV